MEAVDQLERDVVRSVGQSKVHGLGVREFLVEDAVHEDVDVALPEDGEAARRDEDEVRDAVGHVQIRPEDGTLLGERDGEAR